MSYSVQICVTTLTDSIHPGTLDYLSYIMGELPFKAQY